MSDIPLTTLTHFPLPQIREKQEKAIQFIIDRIKKGYRDIIVEMPTGSGKSPVGMAIASWAASPDAKFLDEGKACSPGAYYLVTQKMLQDQIEDDVPHYLATSAASKAVDLRAADNYTCINAAHRTCAEMAVMKKSCGDCVYKTQKALFLSAPVSVTNYAYFLTERSHIGNIGTRRVLICDEAHNLENELIRCVEIELTEPDIQKFAPGVEMDTHKSIGAFVSWLEKEYIPVAGTFAAELISQAQTDSSVAKEASEAANHVQKISTAVLTYRKGSVEWVYWEPEARKGEDRVQNLRPLLASYFFPDMIQKKEPVRIYMSAFLGNKEVFCQSLGLDPDKVQYLRMRHTFPVENRRVIVKPLGSMAYRSKAETTPRILRACSVILKRHEQKGAIHCGSYALGKEIYEFLLPEFRDRVIFPLNADARDAAFEKHRTSKKPTVMISPSMVEGYDFKDDLARFQILVKCPFMHLKDAQVVARMKKEPRWYDLRTCMAIVQACGRGCRTETDSCVNYLLDSDFQRTIAKNTDILPNWFMESVSGV